MRDNTERGRGFFLTGPLPPTPSPGDDPADPDAPVPMDEPPPPIPIPPVHNPPGPLT
jgi:hypothetical protein